MTRADRDALSRPVVLAYWLTIVGGLVLYTTLRFDDTAQVMALWIGALGGTMLGQYLALRDYRLWIVALILVVCVMYGGPLVPSGGAGTALWQAFIPAALCGYWSLGDRASIAACWFPAVIWMLSILDRADGRLVPDGIGATLLAGFAALFLVLLRAREARRVALWQRFAAVPLAEARPDEVLREPPGRQLARAAWGLTVGAITVAITVWLAPRLWHAEQLAGERAQVAHGAGTHGLPCCPVGGELSVERARVKEYFDLGRGHATRAGSLREEIDCRRCVTQLGAIASSEPGSVEPGVPFSSHDAEPAAEPPVDATGVAPAGAGPVAPVPDASAIATSGTASRVVPPATAPPLPTVAPPPPNLPRQRLAPLPTAPRPPAPSVADRHAPAPDARPSIVPWLLALGLGALGFQLVALGLRPVRRLITLRHLRRPFWDETVDQRVSNAWQLALVGLRDAGWRPTAQEAPHALARRVGVGELERCATILERARHGLGIDAEDLAAMQAAAAAAYAAARRELGPVARAAGWIRWPLT